MAIGATLNAIDSSRSTVATKISEIDSRREDIRTERTSLRANMTQLDADIRDANTDNGSPLYQCLDGHPAATIQHIHRDNATREIDFDYDVDADTISNIVYALKPANNNEGSL